MEFKDIYTKEGREEQLLNGAIDELEEGFMQGYCEADAVAMQYY